MHIVNEEYCCGCTACKNICPKQAINMEKSKEGFFYPQVDEEKCINCLLCERVCPFNEKKAQELKNKLPRVYAVKNKNSEIRKNSSSGGVFTAIAKCILDNDGIVYGATFDDDMSIIHKRITTKGELEQLRGSKYVQSNMKEVFAEIKELLENTNKQILFVGTPCEIAGLKAFIGEKLNKQIILCDIICHGVPSPLIWSEQIKFLEKKYKQKVKWYKFRDKSNGWHTHTEQVILQNGSTDNSSAISQSYKQLFHSNLILRKSCYNCKFADIDRVSDITIGDFWGIDKVMPDFDDNKGISLMLINNEKGQELFEIIKKDIIYRESNTKDCMQPQLQHPTLKPRKRDIMWNEYYKKGYKFILKKYTRYGIYYRMKSHIKKILINLEEIINKKKIIK